MLYCIQNLKCSSSGCPNQSRRCPNSSISCTCWLAVSSRGRGRTCLAVGTRSFNQQPSQHEQGCGGVVVGWSGDDLLVPKQVIVHWNQGGNGPDVLQGFLQPVGRRGFSSRISRSLTGFLATVSCSPRVTQMGDSVARLMVLAIPKSWHSMDMKLT